MLPLQQGSIDKVGISLSNFLAPGFLVSGSYYEDDDYPVIDYFF